MPPESSASSAGHLWLYFVVGAFISWGAYGPSLHKGQFAFEGADRFANNLRAIICVGAAYFLVALLVPVGLLGARGQLGGFNLLGTTFSTLAGTLGALGAICIAFSFSQGGKPFVVMPLVFAGAPIVNALVSLWQHPPEGGWTKIHPLLYVGFALAAGGAWLILTFKDRVLK